MGFFTNGRIQIISKWFPKFIYESESVFDTCLCDLEKKLVQGQNSLAIEMPQGEKLQYLTFLHKNKGISLGDLDSLVKI